MAEEGVSFPVGTDDSIAVLSEYRSTRGGQKSAYFGGGGGRIVDTETKRYVDAKVEAMSAKNDARFAEVLSGISSIGDRLDLQKGLLVETKAAADESKQAASAIWKNNVATGIAVVGVLFAAWALWAQGIEMITGLIDSADFEVNAIDQSQDSPSQGQN